jgi:hypothetical protein
MRGGGLRVQGKRVFPAMREDDARRKDRKGDAAGHSRRRTETASPEALLLFQMPDCGAITEGGQVSINWRNVEWVRIIKSFGAGGKSRPYRAMDIGDVLHVEDYNPNVGLLTVRPKKGRNTLVRVESCEPAEEPK